MIWQLHRRSEIYISIGFYYIYLCSYFSVMSICSRSFKFVICLQKIPTKCNCLFNRIMCKKLFNKKYINKQTWIDCTKYSMHLLDHSHQSHTNKLVHINYLWCRKNTINPVPHGFLKVIQMWVIAKFLYKVSNEFIPG